MNLDLSRIFILYVKHLFYIVVTTPARGWGAAHECALTRPDLCTHKFGKGAGLHVRGRHAHQVEEALFDERADAEDAIHQGFRPPLGVARREVDRGAVVAVEGRPLDVHVAKEACTPLRETATSTP